MKNTRISAGIAALCALGLAVSTASAAVIDTIGLHTPSPLSFTDSTGTLFNMVSTAPASSDTFQSFMRIQRTGSEQGYNTNADSGSLVTMDLVDEPGTSTLYMPNVIKPDHKIYLAMNYDEAATTSAKLLNLQELIVVISTDPNKQGPARGSTWTILNMPSSPGDVEVYRMSSAKDGSNNQFEIQLDATKAFADTKQDLFVTLNLSSLPNLATLSDANHYLYVYSRFSGANNTYEEWFALQPDPCLPPPPVNTPEPAALGAALAGGACLLLRRRR